VRHRGAWWIVLAAITWCNAPAAAQSEQSDLERAQEFARTGQPDRSLALVDSIISRASEEAKDPEAVCPGDAAAFFGSFLKDATVSVENDWCEAMLVKAYVLIELKRPVEAEQVLKTLVGHSPGNVNYLTEYAYSVQTNGDLPRALTLYEKAEKIAAKLPDRNASKHWRAVALRGQGYTYSELQRWDEGVKAYNKSLKYEPGNKIALQELAYIAEKRPR
jgi:tetratricopeptide (TPR) repeat protein